MSRQESEFARRLGILVDRVLAKLRLDWDQHADDRYSHGEVRSFLVLWTPLVVVCTVTANVVASRLPW